MHFQLHDKVEEDVFFDDEIKTFLKKIESVLDIDSIVMILDSMLQFQNKLKFVNQPMISLESQFIKLAYLKKIAQVAIEHEAQQMEEAEEKAEQESIRKEMEMKMAEQRSR